MLIPDKIIFCVETETQDKSDCIYIKELINFYYSNTIVKNSISVDYIPMGGKHNYCNKRVIGEIKNKSIGYKNTTMVVIYILDKDANTNRFNDNDFICAVEKYCLKKKYHLVWFVKDIEMVMLGKKSANKTKDAYNFRDSKKIQQVPTKSFVNPNPQYKTGSNVLLVLEKVLGKPENNVK